MVERNLAKVEVASSSLVSRSRFSVTPGYTRTSEIWLGVPLFHLGDWLLAIAALLTLWSGLQYLHAAWPALREDERNAVGQRREKDAARAPKKS